MAEGIDKTHLKLWLNEKRIFSCFYKASIKFLIQYQSLIHFTIKKRLPRCAQQEYQSDLQGKDLKFGLRRMNQSFYHKLCITNILKGIEEGLSKYSNSSKVAFIFAARENDPVSVFDPQNILRGHESKIKEVFYQKAIL